MSSNQTASFEEIPLAKGKTKSIHASKDDKNLVLIKNFDSLTAFNAKRKDEVIGKAAAATQTTSNVFEFLNSTGCKTHFIKKMGDCEFLAQRCEMIPIEWVARRIATGSFLKRNPGVDEGYIFSSPKIETFFKDDANDDPQWSEEQILTKNFVYCNGKCVVGKNEVTKMKRWTSAIFRILERAWRTEGCVLVDMKIEFGVNTEGKILLADVVDNDSWRVWPKGDRCLQLDKQFYRDLKSVTDEALLELKKNYDKVAEITSNFGKTSNKTNTSTIVVVMGSSSDLAYAGKIEAEAKKLGVSKVVKRICSAHKSTMEVLHLVDEYESAAAYSSLVLIAVAGRSNGLGPVMAANCTLPVINSPPLAGEWAAHDIWSSIRMPSGVGCTTVFGAEEAALAASKILAQSDHFVYSKIVAAQTTNIVNILDADSELKK